MMKNKVSLINLISNLMLQFVTIISGFILPKIILTSFGSEVNGLVSSLTQLLGYISLVEGGISGVIIASLYKPLYEKDDYKLSSIVKTTNKFYKKIGFIFIAYAFVVSFIYPLVVKTSFSYEYVVTLSLILSISLIIQYMFSLTLRNILVADKKIYISSFLQTFIIILNIILALISIKILPSIHILKLITGGLFILQPIVYGAYINKKYKIRKDVKIDNDLINKRWNGLAVNIAAFIHNSTDITVLTMFTDLKTVSIYGVYSLIVVGLKQVVTTIETALTPSLGQEYAKENIENLNNKLDLFEYVMCLAVFLLFTLGALLVTPFVMIYTKGITDTNYYQPLFGALILIAEAIYMIKSPHLALAYSTNKFKEITKACYIEAAINIIISVVLVPKTGLIGVAIGTIIAMLYRTIYQINFTKTIIKNRNIKETYKKIGIFILGTIIGVFICLMVVPKVEFAIYSWIISAIIYTIIMIIDYYIISKLFFKKEFNFVKKYIFK